MGCGLIFQLLGSAEIQSWDPVSASPPSNEEENRVEAQSPQSDANSSRL